VRSRSGPTGAAPGTGRSAPSEPDGRWTAGSSAVTRWVAAGICAYEAAAITTGRIPTVTQVCTRCRWLGPVLVTVLAVHLYRQPKKEVAGGQP
jgi:hypothetical protein